MNPVEFPALVCTTPSATYPGSVQADQLRFMADTRPTYGVYNAQPASGAVSGPNVAHRFFMNSSNWDLSTATGNTAFSLAVTGTQFLVYGVILEMVTSKNPVLNGSSFGGQYLGGLLGLVTLTPGPLANGLALRITSGGVTTQLALLTVNEDFGLGSYPVAGGSLTGGIYTFRARYEVRQPLLAGTSDAIVWQVQDNMTGRGISELRAIAYGSMT